MVVPAEHPALERPETPLPIYTDIEVHELPDPEWLVEDLFLVESLVGLYGPTGHGKTFVGLDLAFAIGTGRPFHGKGVTTGNVVYVYAEGAPSLKFRVDAWKVGHGWALDEETNVWFVPTAVDLAGEGGGELDDLLTTIQAIVPEPIQLVVIDTLARCFGGADEDSTQAMNRFTNRCARLREETGATVMVVHHTGWEPKRERGNKSLRNNFDTLIRCSKTGQARIELKCEKQKDAPPFDPVRLRFDEIELPEGCTSCVLRSEGSYDLAGTLLDSQARTALLALASLDVEGATFTDWRRATEAKGLSESTFKRRRDLLSDEGYVTPPPDADSTRGFRYKLTAKGWAALDSSRVQNGVNPNSGPHGRSARSGPTSVPVEEVDNAGHSVGSNSGPLGSMNPSADSGSGGGAYRAPPGPEAPAQDRESNPGATGAVGATAPDSEGGIDRRTSTLQPKERTP